MFFQSRLDNLTFEGLDDLCIQLMVTLIPQINTEIPCLFSGNVLIGAFKE